MHAPSWLLLSYAPQYARDYGRTYLWISNFSFDTKCLASLHFTDTAVDLVINCAVGLNFKDFFTTFRLICHVSSTNRSCQTKGPSQIDYIVSLNRYHTDPDSFLLKFSDESKIIRFSARTSSSASWVSNCSWKRWVYRLLWFGLQKPPFSR